MFSRRLWLGAKRNRCQASRRLLADPLGAGCCSPVQNGYNLRMQIRDGIHFASRGHFSKSGLVMKYKTTSPDPFVWIFVWIDPFVWIAAAWLLSGCGLSAAAVQSSGPVATVVEITTAELQSLQKTGQCVVVDTRDSNAFNGWRLDGVARGGHIVGAVNFSAGWLDVQHSNRDEILDAALADKGIVAGKKIVLCDANGRDREKLAAWLQARGLAGFLFYDLKQWADDEQLPLEKCPSWQLLVPAVVVQELVDGKKPESFEESAAIKFAEVSWGDETKSYDQGHVPGSFHINTDSVEPPPRWKLAGDEQLAAFARAHGFKHDDTVILSGKDPMASYRLAVVLRYIGVRDVRVLNGGLSAWKAADFPLETARHTPVPSAEFGVDIPGRPELITTYRELLGELKDTSRFTLVDNRTWEEHIGEKSGYSYHFKKGRIPGAKFGYAGKTDASSLGYYRNIDDTMRSADEILGLWKTTAIDPKTHLSFMCGSGWRAAEVLTYANVIGIDDASIYSDGWIGWSNNPDNPIETGSPSRMP